MKHEAQKGKQDSVRGKEGEGNQNFSNVSQLDIGLFLYFFIIKVQMLGDSNIYTTNKLIR